jgi:hypothetical protein
VGKIVGTLSPRGRIRAFTPVFAGYGRAYDFAHANSAPLPTLPRLLRGPMIPYATALITRATLANISSISRSLTISGGVSAMVSPVTRMTRFSALNACSMAS